MAEKEYIERRIVLKPFSRRISKLSGEPIIIAINQVLSHAEEFVKSLPAADVAPVKHGHWKKGKGCERPTENGFVHDDKYICDCCGWGCCCETKLDFNFCPNCGAKNGR